MADDIEDSTGGLGLEREPLDRGRLEPGPVIEKRGPDESLHESGDVPSSRPIEPPPIIDDRLLELIITAAKLLVVVVYLAALFTFTMLTLGFFLQLAGASPDAPFVEWVYRSNRQAMKPFRGMFPIQEIDGRSVFDSSLLFAAALYGFVAIGLHALVVYLSAIARQLHRRSPGKET